MSQPKLIYDCQSMSACHQKILAREALVYAVAELDPLINKRLLSIATSYFDLSTMCPCMMGQEIPFQPLYL